MALTMAVFHFGGAGAILRFGNPNHASNPFTCSTCGRATLNESARVIQRFLSGDFSQFFKSASESKCRTRLHSLSPPTLSEGRSTPISTNPGNERTAFVTSSIALLKAPTYSGLMCRLTVTVTDSLLFAFTASLSDELLFSVINNSNNFHEYRLTPTIYRGVMGKSHSGGVKRALAKALKPTISSSPIPLLPSKFTFLSVLRQIANSPTTTAYPVSRANLANAYQ